MAPSRRVTIGFRRPGGDAWSDTSHGSPAGGAGRRSRAATRSDAIDRTRDADPDGGASVAPSRGTDGPVTALRTPPPALAQALAAQAASSQEFR